jgi:hypothetical protein
LELSTFNEKLIDGDFRVQHSQFLVVISNAEVALRSLDSLPDLSDMKISMNTGPDFENLLSLQFTFVLAVDIRYMYMRRIM